ncbi:hypothetical protein ACO0LG_28295 [Undibacterium sp. Ji42W]|uniref:hypothetical protein n=1 Tax=Undibacterium sp. Ji42W TaxID=3413039 RepID=UPI003BF2D862
MNIEQMTEFLEKAWDDGGVLALIRVGRFDVSEGEAFIHVLKNMHVDDHALLPKRFVSLTWYLPSFLEWQKRRVEEVTGGLASYEIFIVEVCSILEGVLGVP